MSEIDVAHQLDTAAMSDPAKTFAAVQAYLRSIDEGAIADQATSLGYLEGGSGDTFTLTVSDFTYNVEGPLFAPDLVVDRAFRNDSDATIQDTFSYNKTLQESQTFSFTEGLKVGSKASGKIGLPLVGETSVEVSAEVTFGATQTFSVTSSQSWSQSTVITLPPHTSAKVTGLVKVASNKDRPFSAIVRVSGGSFNFHLFTAETVKDWPFIQVIIPIAAVLSPPQMQFILSGKWTGGLGVGVLITAQPA